MILSYQQSNQQQNNQEDLTERFFSNDGMPELAQAGASRQ